MLNLLPFPNINGNNDTEKIEQIIAYLMQLKEEVEYSLTHITLDDLTEEVKNKIESVNQNIKETESTQEEQIQQLLNSVLKVDDVLASNKFNDVLQELEERVNAYTDKKIGEIGGTE